MLQRTDDPPKQSQIQSTTHTVSKEINRWVKMYVPIEEYGITVLRQLHMEYSTNPLNSSNYSRIQ